MFKVASLLFALTVAACGGTNTPASPSTAASAASAPPATSASESAEASQPAESAAGGGGGGATGSSKWCLNTTDEVGAAFGVGATTEQGADVAGSGGGCIYSASAGPVLSIAVVQPAPAGLFQGMSGSQVFKQLSGIGDAAVLASNIGPLVLEKGTTVVTLTVMPAVDIADKGKIQAALEQLAKSAVTRIP
jgi:hypothetical protein